MIKKLYLSASTQENNIGVDGVSEESRMQELVKDIIKDPRLGQIAIYINRPDMTLTEVIVDSNKTKPDFHLALHSNAMGGKESGKARGMEAWIHKDSIGGDRMADLLVKYLHQANGLLIRGGKEDPDTKETTVDGGHLAELDRTNAPACLIELFFHDNAADVENFKKYREGYKDAIVRAILDY
jgi:N-acetylmuramoyl-L-alanine amidase